MSCRVIKPKEPWHKFAVRPDRKRGEVTLVGGPRPYLVIHADVLPGATKTCVSISGQQTLRALARAILKNTKPRRKR